MKLQHLSVLSSLGHATEFIESFAELWPHDSRPRRLAMASVKIMQGVNGLSSLALKRTRRRWNFYTNAKVIRLAIQQHGSCLAIVNESWHNPTHVWQIGEHVVAWENDWGSDCLMSASTLDDLACEALGRTLAALGPEARAMITAGGIVVDTERAPAVQTSEIAEVCEKLRRELEFGHRSMLLHGPTGTGKTAASRQLVEALADSAMVVSSEMFDAGGTLGNDIFGLLCTWRPKAVVFDDLDHALAECSEAWILGGVSRVRAVVPLVIATANVSEEFSGALLRPGRFDRMLRVDSLDESIARSMITHVPRDVADDAISAGLRAAYLAELDIEVRGGDDPRAALADMIARQSKAGDGLRRERETNGKSIRVSRIGH